MQESKKQAVQPALLVGRLAGVKYVAFKDEVVGSPKVTKPHYSLL